MQGMLYPEFAYGLPERTVMDPVHGPIPVFNHELRALDHPLLQRLKHIKQTDVLYYVFPAATHTRFTHSIGVMHVAGRCFQALVQSGLHQVRARTGCPAPIDADTRAAIQYLYLLVRFAGLLHDLGHGPFSHEFEASDQIQALYRERNLFEHFWSGEDWTAFMPNAPDRWQHDHVTIRLALSVCADVGGCSLDKRDVIGVLSFPHGPTSSSLAVHVANLMKGFGVTDPAVTADYAVLIRSLLNGILTGHVSADGMDWLLRDSLFSGSDYGVFQMDHLISSLRLGFRLDAQRHPTWLGLAVAEKGLGSVQDFAFSRMQLYRHVYGHKAVVGFKILFQEALEEVLEDRQKQREIVAALADPKLFALLDDTAIWRHFVDVARGDSDTACHDLLCRRKLRHLETLENPNADYVTERRAAHEAADTTRRVRVLFRTTTIRRSGGDPDCPPLHVLTHEKDPVRTPTLAELRNPQERFPLQLVHLFEANSGWARTRPRQSPRTGFLICGVGVPCCGKSTILRYLAGKLGAEYFREPEEATWPEAVLDRDKCGHFGALTWFRSVRVPQLLRAAGCREAGGLAVVDTYYDKLIHCYLGREAVEWLIHPSDPYFEVYKEVARLDYEHLPTANLLILFSVTEPDWHRFRAIRNRALDHDKEFARSFKSQEYFREAARRLHDEQGVTVFEYARSFSDSPTPCEDAADDLFDRIRQLLPL